MVVEPKKVETDSTVRISWLIKRMLQILYDKLHRIALSVMGYNKEFGIIFPKELWTGEAEDRLHSLHGAQCAV